MPWFLQGELRDLRSRPEVNYTGAGYRVNVHASNQGAAPDWVSDQPRRAHERIALTGMRMGPRKREHPDTGFRLSFFQVSCKHLIGTPSEKKSRVTRKNKMISSKISMMRAFVTTADER